ncbi:MAG: hypothetical protein DRJ15_10195, partial [Bacteroidetes bacterium]
MSGSEEGGGMSPEEERAEAKEYYQTWRGWKEGSDKNYAQRTGTAKARMGAAGMKAGGGTWDAALAGIDADYAADQKDLYGGQHYKTVEDYHKKQVQSKLAEYKPMAEAQQYNRKDVKAAGDVDSTYGGGNIPTGMHQAYRREMGGDSGPVKIGEEYADNYFMNTGQPMGGDGEDVYVRVTAAEVADAKANIERIESTSTEDWAAEEFGAARATPEEKDARKKEASSERAQR